MTSYKLRLLLENFGVVTPQLGFYRAGQSVEKAGHLKLHECTLSVLMASQPEVPWTAKWTQQSLAALF